MHGCLMDKTDKVRHNKLNMTQIANLLAVATVFIGSGLDSYPHNIFKFTVGRGGGGAGAYTA